MAAAIRSKYIMKYDESKFIAIYMTNEMPKKLQSGKEEKGGREARKRCSEKKGTEKGSDGGR